jgi:quinol monooxygenase YgiN
LDCGTYVVIRRELWLIIGVSFEEKSVIHVIALITAKPGMRPKILELAQANLAAVRAEQGCIEYGPALDADPALPFQAKLGPDSFMVIEKWQSMDALKAHAAAPHMRDYGAKAKDYIASRVIHILNPA